VLKLEITQAIQDSLANIKLQANQQYTALKTNTTMATMTTMTMTTMPPPVQPHSLHNPADLVTPHRERELEPRLGTSFEEANAITNASATPQTATPLTTKTTTTPTTQITLPIDKLSITASTY